MSVRWPFVLSRLSCLLLLAAVACMPTRRSDDRDNRRPTDERPDAGDIERPDAGDDERPDGGDDELEDAFTGTPAGVRIDELEAEPGENDSLAEDVDAAVPFWIEGAVQSSGDVDRYVLTTTRPLVTLTLRLEAPANRPDAAPRLTLAPEQSDGLPARELALTGSARSTQREVFAARPGRYVLTVSASEGAPFRYRVAVSVESDSALPPRPLPLVNEPLSLTNGQVRTRVLQVPANQRLSVTLSNPGRVVAPLLLVVRPSTGEVLASAADPTGEATTLPVEHSFGAAENVWVVVDSVRPLMPSGAVSLSASATSLQATEHEPNDLPANANAIGVDQPLPLLGAINPAGDRDRFTFAATAGVFYSVTADPAPSSVADPHLTINEIDGSSWRAILTNADSNGEGARVDFIATRTGPHGVLVQDDRNVTGGSVGSAAHRYELRVRHVTPQPVATLELDSSDVQIAPDAVVSPAGSFALVRLEVPHEAMLNLSTEDVRGGLVPYLLLVDAQTGQSLAGATWSLRQQVAAGSYWLLMRDANGRGGPGYSADVHAAAAPMLPAPSEPNDTTSEAPPILVGAYYTGELLPGDVDVFAIDVPEATFLTPMPLSSQTVPDTKLNWSPARLLDVSVQGDGLVVEVLSRSGVVLAQGTSQGGAARVSDWAVPRPGRYFVRISGGLGVQTTYVLWSGYEPCKPVPGAAPPSLWSLGMHDGSDVLLMTEVLYGMPTGTAGDANGDGQREQQGRTDEFVELVNVSTRTLDLSGVTVTNKNKAHYVFACGSTLAPKAAAVIFGGGTPTGTFGGSFVDVAHPRAGADVGFDTLAQFSNNNDVVAVRSASGELLDAPVGWGGDFRDWAWLGCSASALASCERQGDFSNPAAPPSYAPRGYPGPYFSPGVRWDGLTYDGRIP